MSRPRDIIELGRRLAAGLASRWRNGYLKLRGMRIDGYANLRRVNVPRQAYQIRLGDGAALDAGVTLLSVAEPEIGTVISIGARCYVNRNTIIDASHCVEIGDEVAVGPGCYITDHDHGTASGQTVLSQPLRSGSTRIGRGAWLGAHVIVLRGVEIGENTVVGAGSVVTRSLPADVIAAGRPARIIRPRD